ncbi:MAG: SH3 domain-containing protein [Chloroflexi bacterium]|nr:SH3 domain-containing protein [Chloroflexota bacterium]
MYKCILFLAIALAIVGSAAAQEGSWQTGSDGSEYNCTSLSTVLSALADGDLPTEAFTVPFVRYKNGTEASLQTYLSAVTMLSFALDEEALVTMDTLFETAISACDASQKDQSTESSETFTVMVNGDVNLRSCAGTNCDIVETASNGSMLTVIDTEGDWYKVQLEDGTAYIASWLTMRGPDDVINVDEAYFDPRTGCAIAFNVKRGDPDMNILLSGERRGDVVVDLYRPNETRPLRVEGQLDKTFIDTGDAYIHQYYSWNVGWPAGTYQLELKLDGKTSKLAWEMKERADYYIYVMCD